MKIFYIVISIYFILIGNSFSIASEKIAFIDLNFILSNSIEGKKILDQLEVENSKNLKFFQTEEKNLKIEKEKIEKLRNILSKDEYNRKINSFNNELNLYKQKKSKMIKSFEDSKNSELNTFFSNLNEIMNSFMQENSINLILDKKNIIMANNKNDISQEILQLINIK